jgi:LysR family transcriptional regulator, hypochlorite-specific transcription factor HypT
MRLEWLEDLLAVVETGSFTEAASRRHLTQSAFSRRIRSIEDHVGVELFDRTRKPVQLRPGTLDQHDRIRQVAQTLRQLALDLKRGGLGLENRIVLASQHALTTSLTPALVQRIQALPGNIRVRLRSANLDECFGLLLACQADIALVYRAVGEEHPIEADYIETLEIGAERLIPIHSSVDRDRLDAQLEGGELPVVAYPDEVFLGRIMKRAILPRLRNDVQVLPRVETALTLAALELTSVGIGVAWVPASLARDRILQGRVVDLSDQLPSCPLIVTAVRLVRDGSAIEAAVWEQISVRV